MCAAKVNMYLRIGLKSFRIRNNLELYRKFCTAPSNNFEEEEFRVLELYPDKQPQRKFITRFQDAQIAPPREKRMPIDQDWPSVWPTAKVFRPSVVPLALYQGYDQKRAPPGKYCNVELMKIPNFLHLTPPAIKRHCEAIKKFCTNWPKGLETDEDIEKHFPVEIITSDYCHSSPIIRDERSRIVTLQVKLRHLNLNYHGRDKLIRLVGNERYKKTSDLLTFVADRCPLRKQNYDYLIYLLTAVHHESWITEPWEHEKTEADMEKFYFENSRIQKHVVETIQSINSSFSPEKNISEEDIKNSAEVIKYGKAVEQILNEEESESVLAKYKESVLNLLSLKGYEEAS